MNNTMTVSNSTLQDCLTYNNRFAGLRLTADQLGADNLKTWNDLVEKLHSSAYAVYALCENSDLSVDSKEVDKSAVFNALRAILSAIGDVNGHKVYANEELATLIIGYAGKRGNADSPALQLCLSRIRNRQKELADSEKFAGVNPDYITMLKEDIEKLTDEKNDLLKNPDNRIKKPTRTTASAFRLDVEHRLARVIAEQQAKSWEELEAEAEAKRKERRAKTKAKKTEAKKAESK